MFMLIDLEQDTDLNDIIIGLDLFNEVIYVNTYNFKKGFIIFGSVNNNKVLFQLEIHSFLHYLPLIDGLIDIVNEKTIEYLIKTNDKKALNSLLKVLEDEEYYELCNIVLNKIKNVIKS